MVSHTTLYEPPVRWMLVKNIDSTPCPPYGIMAVADVVLLKSLAVIEVQQTTAASAAYLLNGHTSIKPGELGQGHQTYPSIMAYEASESNAPAPGDIWGPAVGTWKIKFNQQGFVILGGGANGLVNATFSFIPATGPTPVLQLNVRGTLTSGLAYQGSATCQQYYWNGAADVPYGLPFTVYDWLLEFGQSIASGKNVITMYDDISKRFYVVGAQCP